MDDFLCRPINPDAVSDILEVIEDRHGLRSTILTSQLPVANWYASSGDSTIADALLGCLRTNLHTIELNGASMRKVVPSTDAYPTFEFCFVCLSKPAKELLLRPDIR